MVNLICEQCLVSAFVDQQKVVRVNVVDAVARDFDLADGNSFSLARLPQLPLLWSAKSILLRR